MRRQRPARAWAVPVAASLVVACAGNDDQSDETAVEATITVFAAASLTDAFTELATDFEADNPGVTVELNLAASSALREQILAGAPADVYAAANTSNMDQVADGGAVEETPQVFVSNALEIAVPAGNPAGVSGLADFEREELLIGLCAEEVPCGQFGREALAAAGVAPAPDTNEPDVRSLLTKVTEGELDAGIVYRTDVLAEDGVEGIVVPDDQNVVADYPIAALADTDEPAGAAEFIEFVLGADGQDILTAYGFDGA